MTRTPLMAAGLSLSLCLASASVASAAPSSTPAAPVAMAAAAATPRQAAVTRITTVLTTFYTDQQLSLILNRLGENIHSGKTIDVTYDALAPVDVLTPAQTLKMLKMQSGLRTDLGSASGAPRTKARTVFLANFRPFYTEASAKILAMKRAGQTKARCFQEVDLLVSKHLTQASVARALTQYKGSLTAKEWQSVRTHGADMLLWSKYRL